MKKLIRIDIEAITKDYIHYCLTFSTKMMWRKKEIEESVSVVHHRISSLTHRSVSGLSLMKILSWDLQKIVHAKLMLIIEQGKNKYIF